MITRVCSKIIYEPTLQQSRKSEEKFHETDTSLNNVLYNSDSDRILFDRISRIICSDITQGYIQREDFQNLRYGHGPGAVSDTTLHGSAKYTFGRQWSDALNAFFPVDQYGYANLGLWSSTPEMDRISIENRCNMPVRVVFVPKSVKGPRTIAIEPACNQFIQQGIKNLLYERIESSDYTRRSIRFTDQTVNQDRARIGSIDDSLATIDLSEASDRVKATFVWDMLDVNPTFRTAVFACRSTHAQLPSGTVIKLNKFASMGSALCFTMEALFFYVILQIAFHEHHSVPVTPQSIKKFSEEIDIYGDDIIIPRDMVDGSIALLERFGLKVNKAKSFTQGPFRESCGTERYLGEEIRPSYLRTDPTKSTRQLSELLSFLAFNHQLVERGFDNTAAALRTSYEAGILYPNFKAHWRKLPFTPLGFGHGWPSYDGFSDVYRRSDTQSVSARIVTATLASKAAIQDTPRLTRFLFETESRRVDESSALILDRIWELEPQRRNSLRLRRGTIAL